MNTTILKRTCEPCDNCKHASKDKNTNLATFRFRKTMVKGVPFFTLLDWHNVCDFWDLPNEYTNSNPCFWQYADLLKLNESLLHIRFAEMNLIHARGKPLLFDHDEFQYFNKQAKIAGERLTKINRELRQPKDVEFEITI